MSGTAPPPAGGEAPDRRSAARTPSRRARALDVQDEDREWQNLKRQANAAMAHVPGSRPMDAGESEKFYAPLVENHHLSLYLPDPPSKRQRTDDGEFSSPSLGGPHGFPPPSTFVGPAPRDDPHGYSHTHPPPAPGQASPGPPYQPGPSQSGPLQPGSPAQTPTILASLTRPISPPPRRQRLVIKSPFQLTRIKDLPNSENIDTVTLEDLLGDPEIEECWEFNYLHDIPFLVSKFHENTREKVKIHVVHGFWKQDDPTRLVYEEDASQFSNVALCTAPMEQMFGTHHTKMMILFRPQSAQVIIHTANMIAKDWTNLTNAVWASPLLPRMRGYDANRPPPAVGDRNQLPIGSPERFKYDLLNYLRAYNSRRAITMALVSKLGGYDFSPINAVFIASVPGKHSPHINRGSTWGWPALKRALREVPCHAGKSEVVIQVSSIASLGTQDTWLKEHFFRALEPCKNMTITNKPRMKIVFPTADEIRRSLNGYDSGASIHTKIQTAKQEKQLQYLLPHYHHWANDAGDGKELPMGHLVRDGGRRRAAPHIKTYIRFSLDSDTIDWALLTSANLSRQAWGDVPSTAGDVRIASWEVGVLLWPSLVTGEASTMVGTFKTDAPGVDDIQDLPEGMPVMGLRIPYSLPLRAYGKGEIPWVASMLHRELDWKGRAWGIEDAM